MNDTGIVLTGDGDKRVDVGSGTLIAGANAEGAFFKRDSESKGAADWRLSDCTSRTSATGMSHYAIGGERNRYIATGSTFEGGRLEASAHAFEGGHMLHTANVEKGVDRSGLPEESGNIQHRNGNLIIGAAR
ncbi:hypothetical protein [Paenibacillus mendelii]|uniref:Uncharacterized protein n=1 Tax=Paenibacillus mendelii TaxID=206163 RepID=A0ABV6J3F5_9BACL|nr:hypothetical protein [Paenibacillus mendelii]MCQ6559436.1 hypothetical protein [Paenibacillus mendelii]